MRVTYYQHARDRMRQRRIADAEVREALEAATTAYSTPKGSTCIVGTTRGGRVLKIWVKGDASIPIDGKVIVKSVAGRDEEDA